MTAEEIDELYKQQTKQQTARAALSLIARRSSNVVGNDIGCFCRLQLIGV